MSANKSIDSDEVLPCFAQHSTVFDGAHQPTRPQLQTETIGAVRDEGQARSCALRDLIRSRNRRAWGGASGVNWQRSGLRSMSGVLSRQSRPLTRSVGPRARPERRAPCRSGSAEPASAAQTCRASAIIGRALAHEIAARLVQPVEDLDPLERLDPVQRRDPGLVDLDPADRPVGPPLARTFEPRRPGRADDFR